MSDRIPAKRTERWLNMRVQPLALVCILFVLIAIGTMMINSVRNDTASLEVRVTDLRIARDQLLKERDSLSYEVQISDTDDYIIAKARLLYNYMMPGELLFVIKNPEALYGLDMNLQMYVLDSLN